MDFKKHFEAAWMNTLKFIGPVLLLTLVQVIVIVLSLGILAPVTTAGYMQSLLQAQREGRPPELRDLFSRMSLFLPLFAFFLLVLIVTMIGFKYPGAAWFHRCILYHFCHDVHDSADDRQRPGDHGGTERVMGNGDEGAGH